MNSVAIRYLARNVVEPSTMARPTVQLEDVQGGSATLVAPLSTLDPVGQNAFSPGDVIFGKLRPYLSKSLLIEDHLQGSAEFLCMRPNARLDSRYLKYVTLSSPWIEHAVLTSYGSKMPRTSWELMASFSLPDTQPEEQRRIADFLDDRVARIDRIIGARKSQTLSASALAMETMAAAFEGVGRQGRLKELLASSPCYGVLKPDYVDDGVPIVRIMDLPEFGSVRPLSLPFITRQQSIEYARTKLVTGDVLLGVVGTLGRPTVVHRALSGANVSRAIARLQPRAGVPGAYLRAVLRLPRFGRFVDEVTQGAAQAVLNMSDLRNYPVPITAPETTGRLVTIAALIEDEGAARQRDLIRSADLLGEYKRSLVTAAVNGEVDVTTARNGIPG